jgi:hypothetical protein
MFAGSFACFGSQGCNPFFGIGYSPWEHICHPADLRRRLYRHALWRALWRGLHRRGFYRRGFYLVIRRVAICLHRLARITRRCSGCR